MSAFAGSRLSADDVSALHTRYHDAMHGTFASDRSHCALPRPLRSHHIHNSRDVSTLATAPRRATVTAQTTSAAAALRTPQWGEFSDCLREVSPHADSSGDANEEESEAFSEEVEGEEEEGTAQRRGGDAAAHAAAERDVVHRLAALSESPQTDAVAVAAALREAEDLLQQKTGRDASPAEDYASGTSRSRPHRRGAARALRVAGKDVVFGMEGGRGRQPRGGYDFVHPQGDGHQGPSESSYRSAAWPWPTMTADRAGGVSAAPMAPTAPQPHMSTIQDATAHWYEVYYAWMLYYQQLYAAQIQQYEREQQQQQRESRRTRSQRRHHHYRHHDATEIVGDRRQHHHSHHYLQEAPREAATRDERVPTDHPRRHRGGHVPASTGLHDSHHSGERGAAGAADGGADAARAETQQLRAQLRQLEAQLVALTAAVAVKDEERDTSHNTQRSPPPRGSTAAHAGTEGRRRPAGSSQSPERVAVRSVAVRPPPPPPPPPAQLTSASTWRALSERQRSRSAVGGERQRPQWR